MMIKEIHLVPSDKVSDDTDVRTEVVINIDDDKGNTFGAIRQGK